MSAFIAHWEQVGKFSFVHQKQDKYGVLHQLPIELFNNLVFFMKF